MNRLELIPPPSLPLVRGRSFALDPSPVKGRVRVGLYEQQKIAACLSSLDELITAQAQKLATLKTHKKGLMQQLFPAVDEVNA